MKLYVFTSRSTTNIWAGVGAQLWAVPKPSPSMNASVRTKAAKMSVGASGIIYCSGSKSLTTPFIVRSPPDQDETISDVWPEPWSLPFAIHSLGTPRLQMHKDDAMKQLHVARSSGRTNISHVLPIPAPTIFSPVEVPDDDWALLVGALGGA